MTKKKSQKNWESHARLRQHSSGARRCEREIKQKQKPNSSFTKCIIKLIKAGVAIELVLHTQHELRSVRRWQRLAKWHALWLSMYLVMADDWKNTSEKFVLIALENHLSKFVFAVAAAFSCIYANAHDYVVQWIVMARCDIILAILMRLSFFFTLHCFACVLEFGECIADFWESIKRLIWIERMLRKHTSLPKWDLHRKCNEQKKMLLNWPLDNIQMYAF